MMVKTDRRALKQKGLWRDLIIRGFRKDILSNTVRFSEETWKEMDMNTKLVIYFLLCFSACVTNHFLIMLACICVLTVCHIG